MSNSVLPSFPGLDWNVVRRPRWNTLVKRSASGRVYMNGNWSYPIWEYRLQFNVLRSRAALPEMQQLAAFFNLHRGRGDSWLFTDPNDNTVTDQVFGTGDGTTTQFQLLRSFGGYSEPVFELNGAPVIKKAGVTQATPANYSISNGLVTFVAAPSAGQSLTWTGSYYWRCLFQKDLLEFNQFMKDLWDLRAFEFETIKP